MTVASPVYLGARGVPRHPDELQARASSTQEGDRVPGHAIVGYFSSLTARRLRWSSSTRGSASPCTATAWVAVNESTAHIHALLSGVGLGQTFRFAAAPYLASGRLSQVLPQWTRPRHPLHLLYPSKRHLSAKLRAFADWAVEVFAPYDGQ